MAAISPVDLSINPSFSKGIFILHPKLSQVAEHLGL